MARKLYSSRNMVPRTTLKAPSNLCIYTKDAISETTAFLKEIGDTIFLKEQYVELDFTETVRMTAAAALILFARVTICQAQGRSGGFQYPDHIVRLKSAYEMPLYPSFVASGLWLAFTPGAIAKVDGNWVNTPPLKTGQKAETQTLNALKWIVETIGFQPDKMHRAVQEAFLNIKHHSYSSNPDLPDFFNGRWWQYSYVETKANGHRVLNFLVYDVGSGIPFNVRNSSLVVDASFISDAECIEIAMKKGFSTTGIKGRGKGSEDLKKPTMVTEDRDQLCIWSGHGFVMFQNGTKIESKNISQTISGTLIEWSLAIEDN